MNRLGAITLAGSVFVLAAIACGTSQHDDRPAEVKAAADRNAATPAGDHDAILRAAYLNKIQLRSITATASKNALTSAAMASVHGEVKNIGDKSVDEVQITIYFLDAKDHRVHEDTYHPVLAGNTFKPESPLKPNYARQFGAGFEVPSDWAGKVEVKVTDVKFSPTEKRGL